MSQPPNISWPADTASPGAVAAPRPREFGWIAMIIAVVRSFGVGAAVVALGSTDTTGTPAAQTTMTESAPNDKPVAASPNGSSPSTSGHRS
jgi:hypothetical protein